jgi:uncharacterized membrane protein
MIRRWIGPVLLGGILCLVAGHTAMVAMPDVLMALAVKRVSAVGGINQFTHAPLATAASRTIVRPSPDLAYSSCPFDLTHGPLLIDAVPVPAPYWSLSIFDTHTNVALVRNGEKADYQPFKVAVLAPGQIAPTGYEGVHVEGTRGIALVRILIDLPARFPAIDQERRATLCRAG